MKFEWISISVGGVMAGRVFAEKRRRPNRVMLDAREISKCHETDERSRTKVTAENIPQVFKIRKGKVIKK